ncbi:MAG TPA: hypothetical protein VD995_04685 [Azospirillum sp.]|nr:hypothetical protein [Azospirillum sp.]
MTVVMAGIGLARMLAAWASWMWFGGPNWVNAWAYIVGGVALGLMIGMPWDLGIWLRDRWRRPRRPASGPVLLPPR